MAANLNRREFLKRFYRWGSTVGIFAIAPVPLIALPKIPPVKDIIEKPHPFWLKVLSRGPNFIPKRSVFNIIGWDNDKVLKLGLRVLAIALKQNRQFFQGQFDTSDRKRDIIISNNKVAQYLLEKVVGTYISTSTFPPVRYSEDPARARQFYYLSAFIIRHIIKRINKPDFYGFNNFEIDLLNSSADYSRENIAISLRAINIAPENVKNKMISDLGAAYNNLGLAINFMGDVVNTKELYDLALKLKPGDIDIQRNILAIEQNACYIRKIPDYSDPPIRLLPVPRAN